MAKICPNCETENPTAFSFCGKCGFQLVEDEELSEEDKLRKQLAEQKEHLELLKRNKELEEEKLKKELQEKEKKLKEQPKKEGSTPTPPIPKPILKQTVVTQKKSNGGKIALIVVLVVIALVVFGIIYYNNVYLPAKIDREADRYFSFVNLNFRSSKDAGGDYNKIGSIPYGAELITYEHDSEWSYVKFKESESDEGKKGYVSSVFMLDKKDFIRLNSIFGDTESKGCISTSKCRLALLNYFKEKDYIGKISSDVLAEILPYFTPTNNNQWQVFCRDFKLKPNNVFYPKLYNKDAKFTDFAVILKNINTGERRLLLFYFDDDETPHLYYQEPVYDNGYIVNISTKYDYYTQKYNIITKYSN